MRRHTARCGCVVVATRPGEQEVDIEECEELTAMIEDAADNRALEHISHVVWSAEEAVIRSIMEAER